mgnify:CR=1 FL=1
MTEQQIPKLAGALVEHQAAFGPLPTDDAQWVIQNTVAAINLFVTAVQNRGAEVTELKLSILELVSTIVVPPTISKFVAKEKFVRDTGRKAKVKISYLGDNFTDWFLKGDGKIEDRIAEQVLRYHTLKQASIDGPIIAELGGEEKSETILTEMFSLMEKQANGEAGVLLTNGYANIFYIKDQNGALRAVGVSWGGDGWLVDASSVEGPGWWSGGGRVFSRNSVLESSETPAPAQV